MQSSSAPPSHFSIGSRPKRVRQHVIENAVTDASSSQSTGAATRASRLYNLCRSEKVRATIDQNLMNGERP